MLVHLRTAPGAMARMGRTHDPQFRSGRSAGPRALAVAAALIGGLLLSACKTLSPDAGMDAVADIAGDALTADVLAIRTPEQAAATRARIEQRLRRPLTARAAVQV